MSVHSRQRMPTRQKPPRPWEVDDLLDLGRREGVKYLKIIPVLILENWVRGRREKDAANYVRTKALARRLEKSGLVSPFKPKGTSNILGALGAIQGDRNLSRPPLIEFKGNGMSWVNLPHYEPLLQEYRQKYCELYPEEYEKLFSEGEPEWGASSASNVRAEAGQTKSRLPGSQEGDEIESLLAPVEHAMRDQQQAVARLTKENQKLKVELVALQSVLRAGRETPERRIVDEELRNDCSKHLENSETYIDAIRRAGVVFEERLRKTIGGDGQEKFTQGVDLVDYALTPKSGRLIISDHPAEQDGVRMLFRGAVQFVRNPPAHKKVQYSELEAWQTIGLIDYLLLLLRQAKRRKT